MSDDTSSDFVGPVQPATASDPASIDPIATPTPLTTADTLAHFRRQQESLLWQGVALYQNARDLLDGIVEKLEALNVAQAAQPAAPKETVS